MRFEAILLNLVLGAVQQPSSMKTSRLQLLPCSTGLSRPPQKTHEDWDMYIRNDVIKGMEHDRN